MSVMESEERCVDCGDVMDIAGAQELRGQLLDALASQQTVTLDASHVERADTAALQVLGAFFKDAISQKQTLQWKDPSTVLSGSAALIGMTEVLHLNADFQ